MQKLVRTSSRARQKPRKAINYLPRFRNAPAACQAPENKTLVSVRESFPPKTPKTTEKPVSAVIVSGYAHLHISPRCDCKGKGGQFHNFNVRCSPCRFCSEWIKGIWFNEHECECWKRNQ
jgi:hypothetical protein